MYKRQIYTYSVVRENDLAAFRGALPYVVAIVELDAGPRLMTTLVDSPGATIVVGAAVDIKGRSLIVWFLKWDQGCRRGKACGHLFARDVSPPARRVIETVSREPDAPR